MIDREQVLHVARLARLELSDDEVEPHDRRAVAILDHIEKISSSTSTASRRRRTSSTSPNALRADEPRPCLPREVALAQRARRRRRRLPRPEPDRHERHRRAHRRAGGGRRRAGDLTAGELFEAYRDARRGRRPQRVRVGRRRGARDGERRRRTAPLGGVPLGVKDLFCTEGVPTPGRLEDPRGLPPAVHGDGRRASSPSAGAPLLGKTNQDEFAMGSSNENSAFGPVLNPWDRDARPGRLERRQRRRGRRRPRAVGARAPTPAARSASPPRCAASSASSRPTASCQPLRDDRVRLVARPGGPAHARRHRRRAAVRPHDRPRRPRRDLGRSSPRRSRLPTRERLDGIRLGVPGRPDRRGRRARRHGALRGHAGDRRASSARPSSACRCRTPTTALSAYYVLAPAEASSNLARFDGVRYGLRGDADDLLTMYTETRHDGFGAEVKRRIMHRHLRAVERLLRRLLRPRAAGAHEDRRRLPRRLRAGRLHRHADEPERRLRARRARPTTRWRCTSTTTSPSRCSLAGIPAISIPSGLSEGLPVGFQIAGPAFSENRILDAAYALEQAIGFDNSAARA